MSDYLRTRPKPTEDQILRALRSLKRRPTVEMILKRMEEQGHTGSGGRNWLRLKLNKMIEAGKVRRIVHAKTNPFMYEAL